MTGEISNFGELITTVEEMLYDRKDLKAVIPKFVRLAEQRIYRVLRVPANEVIWRVEEQATDRVTIPFDFLEAKVVVYDGRPLTRISDAQYLAWASASDAQGLTKHFCRIGKELVLWRPPDKTAVFSMVYWQDLSGQLINDTDTNDILRIAPDLYVYGALLEAMPYLAQDERMAVWDNLYNQAMAQINTQAAEAEYAGSTVSVSPAYSDGRVYPTGGWV